MITQQRRLEDNPWSSPRIVRGGSGPASLILATMLGVGIGLLAAPQPGSKTRKVLRKRLAALGEEVGESLGDVQEVSSKARQRAKQRLARLREDAGEEWEGMGERLARAKSRLRDELAESEDSSPFGPLLMIAAGVAAAYILASERGAPVRSRVQDMATDVKRRATDQWDRFQRGGARQGRDSGTREGTGEERSETRAGAMPSDEAPQAS